MWSPLRSRGACNGYCRAQRLPKRRPSPRTSRRATAVAERRGSGLGSITIEFLPVLSKRCSLSSGQKSWTVDLCVGITGMQQHPLREPRETRFNLSLTNTHCRLSVMMPLSLFLAVHNTECTAASMYPTGPARNLRLGKTLLIGNLLMSPFPLHILNGFRFFPADTGFDIFGNIILGKR